MSILIKGMEMPKSCWDCYFQDCGNCRLNAHKVVDKCIIEDRRDEDCPLVPVPPHGRLIDGEALRQDWLENGENGYVYDTNAFLDSLDNTPTIIPAEEATT